MGAAEIRFAGKEQLFMLDDFHGKGYGRSHGGESKGPFLRCLQAAAFDSRWKVTNPLYSQVQLAAEAYLKTRYEMCKGKTLPLTPKALNTVCRAQRKVSGFIQIGGRLGALDENSRVHGSYGTILA